MLYEEMLTHSAQNVYNLTTFYKHIQKGILKEASGFCLQQETTIKVWRYTQYSYFVNCCIITIGEQLNPPQNIS